jgi:hypothetical protein
MLCPAVKNRRNTFRACNMCIKEEVREDGYMQAGLHSGSMYVLLLAPKLELVIAA